MQRDVLDKLGLSKEQIEEIMAEHGKTVQGVQAKLTMAEDRAKALESDIVTVNQLVSDLKKDNKDTQALQDKIQEYESKVSKLEADRAQERKTFGLIEALTKAGAVDIDYMLYKLGDVELDDAGNIKDIDNRLKDLKDSNPSFFKDAQQQQQDDTQKGYKPIDTKLTSGSATDPNAIAQQDFAQALGLK